VYGSGLSVMNKYLKIWIVFSVLFSSLLIFISPAQASTSVGKAIISIGKVFSTSKDGVEVKLKRRGKVFEGDTITVGKKSRLQLRFIDNQLVVLKENTVFRIDEYKFKDKNDKNKSAALSLLKGGMRSVTGLIGKSARDKYKVRTPVATMGVRGTHYLLQICNSDCGDGVKGLVGTVLEGEIEITNDGGTSVFGKDQFFNVPSNNDAPKSMTNPPAVLISRTEVETNEDEKDESKGKGKGNKQAKKKNIIAFKRKVRNNKTFNRGGPAVGGGPAGGGPAGPSLPAPSINPNLDPNVTPVGFIVGSAAPANAVLIVSGINASSIIPGGGAGIQGINSTSINIDTVNGVANQPVAAFINNPLGTTKYAVFSSGVAVGQGSNSLGVNWGRWINSDLVFENNGVDADLLTGLAFIYSDNITPLGTIGGLSSTTTYTTVDGPAVRDETGALVLGSIDLTIAFGGAAITGFNGTLSGNGRVYTVSLDTPGAFPLDVFLTGDQVPIIAGCTGCPDMITFLIGSAGGAFVGPGAEAFIGSFGLGGIGISGTNIGISGSRVFSASTPPL